MLVIFRVGGGASPPSLSIRNAAPLPAPQEADESAALTFSFSLCFRNPVIDVNNPLFCQAASDIDVAVIGIAAEAMTAPLQFAVQTGLQDVEQQWRQWPALRRPLRSGTHHPAF